MQFSAKTPKIIRLSYLVYSL